MSTVLSAQGQCTPVPIIYESESGLGLISLMDSTGGNRLNPRSLALLAAAIEQALADQSVRAIVLRSAGPAGSAFCLGMDLDSLGASLGQDGNRESRKQAVVQYGAVLERIGSCAKPVIALVGGPVKAGGVGLVAACDIVLAAASASFELSEVLFGLIPANVLPYLLNRRMGLQKARYLILSARCLDGAAAVACGLVDQTCADDAAESTAKSLIKTIMRGEPGALAETKRFLCQAETLDRSTLREMAVATLLELMERPTVQVALDAFAAGGTPPWFGRFKTERSLFWRNHG